MPGVDWTQLSIGGIAAIGIVLAFCKFIDVWGQKQSQEDKDNKDELKKVIENNTAATNCLLNFLQIALTKNESSMNEVVLNSRLIPGMNVKLDVIANQISPPN